MANHIIEVFLFCLNTVPRNFLLYRWVERRCDREEVKENCPLGLGDGEKGKRDQRKGKWTVRNSYSNVVILSMWNSGRVMPSGSTSTG